MAGVLPETLFREGGVMPRVGGGVEREGEIVLYIERFIHTY